MFLDRHIDKGGPDRRLVVEIEMLMLDATRLHRQQYEIALFPIPALAVYDGIAFSFDHEDQESTLMDMLAGLGGDGVNEHTPLLQRRILEGDGVHVEAQLALPRLEHLAVFRADHHRPRQVTFLE